MCFRSLLVLVFAACSFPALAQQSLTGVIRDSSGAVVPGATVIVRQPGRAFERIVESGRDGRFIIAPVAGGEYRIEAIAAGFAVSQATTTVPASSSVEITLTPAAVVEEVQIVSASRQEELRQSLNTNVAVLSRRQIEESGSQTVAEMLREVPGVISRRGTESAGAAGEQVQGLDSRQVLVLLDGQPLLGARGIKRGVINLDRQSTGRLEQIEVVKGAASALYGSDAIGGLINLIGANDEVFYRVILCVLAAAVPAFAGQTPSKTGVLLLAHGGQSQWNEHVQDVSRRVNQQMPAEVAFGMATRASIKAAIDQLVARGVTSIVAVPLFISSHSSVITSTEFLLGLRHEAPPDLAKFAKMSHGSHGAANEHAGHEPAADPASPVSTAVPVRMTAAFNRHALIGTILADRARSISSAPATEAVIVVAHGPVPDDDNRKWLEDMSVLADHVRKAAPFASVQYMTVRDDAEPAIREAATQELRAKVQAQRAAGRRVLIVPHLMSFGGIEKGLLKRLEGLDYTMTTQALMPDDRIVEWVPASAR
jgi:hypothetical protein